MNINCHSEESSPRLASQFGDHTVFHNPEWARILSECYGYSPHNVFVTEGARTTAMMPVLEVSSPFTGCRAVSLPFSDECPPLLSDGVALESLVRPLRDLGVGRNWDYIEIRGDASSIPGAVHSAEFFHHRVALEGTLDEQFNNLAHAQQRNIRKARRERVEIHHLNSRDAMDSYYELHCCTRRKQGVPPQPRRFFHLIHRHLVDSGHGFIHLARFKERWIAGAVFLTFGKKALYKFGASDPSFQHLRANSLLMWEALVVCRQLGATELSFGRTDLWNSGLANFKQSFGGIPQSLHYYRIGVCKKLEPKRISSHRRITITSRLATKAPVPLLRLVGGLLYRHIG